MKKKKTINQTNRESFFEKLSKTEIKSDNPSNLQFILLTVIAYSFSLLCRLIWVYKYSSFEQLKWNGEFIPLTHDSFYFAKQALDAINHGVTPSEALSSLTVLVSKTMPFLKFETIIFYMPAVLGSTIVIPIMLFCRFFNITRVGFISALISSITVSYYNRTMVGYYDTDMLNITLPLLLLYFLMASIKRKQWLYVIFSVISAFLFAYWYVASIYLVGVFSLMTLVYLLLFDRKNVYGYICILLTLSATIPIPFIYRFSFICLIIAISILGKNWEFKIVPITYGISIVLFTLSTLLIPNVSMLINDYVMFVKTFLIKSEPTGLKYFDFTSLTGELLKPDLFELTARISGNITIFIISCLGLLLLIKKQPVFLLLIPLFALGIMSFTLGGRYTIYAVPVAGMGFAYFVFLSSSVIEKKNLQYLLIMFFVATTLIFNIKHIVDYQNPFVVTKKDIEAFTYLKSIANKNDYVYSWWDYGYAVQYYTGLKTLTDGGRNLKNSYIESLVLTTDNQILAYNLTKESAYLYDKSKNESLLEEMIKTLSPKTKASPNDMINLLTSKEYKIKSQGNFNVYLYLPSQMIIYFDGVIKYSNRDLLTGKELYESVYYSFHQVESKTDRLVLSDKAYIDTTKMEAILDKKNYLIKDFYIIDEDRKGNKNIIKKTYNNNSNINAIYHRRLQTLLILDERTLNSLYIQLFIFDNFDSHLFSVVFSKPYVKLYSLN
ncbi:MAG: dolichyl-diphosphooligosaccharide--protein glycosyltransferase subunit STT3 [Thermodesulfovibrionales bacterium]|nr:dolichyl-diphosphooligosaccharide--protein glycosyltransferase subunit STT3 [Thermodesulfovibrionales bacterium]